MLYKKYSILYFVYSYHYSECSLYQLYCFHKKPVPVDEDEKVKSVSTLMEYSVSLKQYLKAYKLADLTM